MTRFFSTAFLLVLLSCNDKKQDNRFVVTGSVKNSSATTIYLQENPANAAPVIIDSTVLAKDGSFELEGSGVRESLYTLRSNDNPYPFAFVINDAKKITVNADLMNHTQPYTVKGSEASQGLIEFEKTSAQFAEVPAQMHRFSPTHSRQLASPPREAAERRFRWCESLPPRA